ncbi:hypothetical protein EV44_g3637 [Erysiphe necator]|uniref:Uncharacterized protein n=1 Tax=Uncinula necator TaxID=52586 RepID=A0A0B1NWV0_UNCNE|nr:hypothetical protein EV44_g3637 [Erysiphe necator]
MRNYINKCMDKRAVAGVHLSPRKNTVLTCHEMTPDQMLAKKEAWQHIFIEFSLINIQKVDKWPKLVAHGVPATIPIENFENKAQAYSKVLIKGQSRWLTGMPKKEHASVVFSVATIDQKKSLKKNGITIGGCLLKVVNYKSMTSKTQFRRCLKYSHLEVTCTKPVICAYCAHNHHTAKKIMHDMQIF